MQSELLILLTLLRLLLEGPGLPVEHGPGHDEDGPGQHRPGSAVTGIFTSKQILTTRHQPENHEATEGNSGPGGVRCYDISGVNNGDGLHLNQNPLCNLDSLFSKYLIRVCLMSLEDGRIPGLNHDIITQEIKSYSKSRITFNQCNVGFISIN